ncbi:Imm45 family immunity protein [Noviherbaspirillum aridicola]|uniref:Immunity protein 45 domain-containing protein n=1 Tax=Noviherbaspirillum aridicola TaxID=2849687 RepID=A0ABQ4Q565_9BURK|nr:Imm45 family immunity protein [Noviherbaspirillum aridicola]GIZ52336.1 hypothetical protein NCCP691_23500 [Noviherbaspirillum aridicola]
MSAWQKLVSLKARSIIRGAVFRFPAKWPYEGMVDLLVLRLPGDTTLHSLIVTSGHKAGHLLVRLPIEAELPGVNALSRQWIVDNWAKWIYPECDVREVLYAKHYAVPRRPKDAL